MSDNLSRKQLADSLIAKQGEWKNVLAKGHDMNADDLEKCKSLKDEVVDLKGRLDAFNVVAGYEDDYKAAEDFLKKPARGMVHANPEQKGAPRSSFEATGSVEAGYTEVELKGREVKAVYETGAGTFSEKTWKAINTTEYKDAFASYLRKRGDTRLMSGAEMKTLEEGLDDQSGYTVPIDVITNMIVQRKPTPTRVAAMCSQLNTSREVVEMLKLNYATDNIYSTGFRVTKTGELPASATTAQVTDTNLFGTIKIPVHTFMIRGLITKNVIEDSAVGILNWMAGKFGETIELLKDDKVLNGIGRMEPLGMLNNFAASSAGSGLDDPKISVINSGDASTLTADGLMNLALDVPEQYEDNCKFVFNKTSTFKAIRQLKDLNDRYLFGAGFQDSGLANPLRPSDLLGYPYVYSGLMPNISAGAYPVIFGDLGCYQVVNRIGFSIQVLDQVYAETNAIALVGRVRFGGATISPWGLRLQKVSA